MLARYLLLPATLLGAISGCNSGDTGDTTQPPRSTRVRRSVSNVLIEDGRAAYTTYCAGCHGAEGDGNGPAAGFLHPRPRDFRYAGFKFSSTRSGRLPTDGDLRRSIKEGLRGSAMPAWPLLPDRTVGALIAYLKTFSEKWVQRRAPSPIPLPDDPYRTDPDKSKAIARGEVVYHGFAACWTCHPAYVTEVKINEHLTAMENPTREGFRPNLFESDGKPTAEGELIFPPDFRRDFVKGGMSVDDLTRSIAAGITGTAMPTWVDSMDYTGSDGQPIASTSDLWAMAYYVQNLIRQRPAKLADGQFTARTRQQTLYFDGELPEPVEVPVAEEGAEDFEEDEE